MQITIDLWVTLWSVEVTRKFEEFE